MNDGAPKSPEKPKPSLWAKLVDFAQNMDARAWRAVAASVAMIVIALIVLVIGRLYYGEQIEAFIDGTLGEARRTRLGLPITIAVFTLTAYVGAPQFVLILACVVAFGPEQGFWFAWIATVVSGGATYFTGRLAGAETRKRLGGATGGRFTGFMGKNAFLASLIVRLVPTAPFVMVNMAFGAARVKFWPYIAGLTIGVLPKTAIFAFGYDGIMDALEGRWGAAALMGGAAIAVWIVVAVIVRRWLRPRDDEAAETAKPREIDS